MPRLKYYNTDTKAWEYVSINGSPGKSAYEHAKENGYTGTEEEFAKLLIKSSDWNAAENEFGHILNRTHYSKIETILEETNLSSYEEDGLFDLDCSIFELGKIYTITYNNILYVCEAIDCGVIDSSLSGTVLLGNYSLFLGTGDTGEPFIILGIENAVLDINSNTTATISVSGEIVHKIDNKFIDAEWMAKSEKKITTFSFDGNLNNREIVTFTDGYHYVKISNSCVNIKDLIGSSCIITDNGIDNEFIINENNIIAENGIIGVDLYNDDYLSFISLSDVNSDLVLTGFSTGLWFAYLDIDEENLHRYTKTLTMPFEIVNKIPIKFLPEGYPYIKSVELPIFSGNLNEYEFIQMSDVGYYVKISPEIITTSATIIGSELSIQNESALVSYPVTEDMIIDLQKVWGVNGYAIMKGGLYVISTASAFSLPGGIEFSPGTWFLYLVNDNNEAVEYTKSISCLTKEVEKIVTLDDKYLSNNIARASDIADIRNDISNIGNGLPDVTTVNNGAFLRVVNGKWAAVKLPSAEDGEF